MTVCVAGDVDQTMPFTRRKDTFSTTHKMDEGTVYELNQSDVSIAEAFTILRAHVGARAAFIDGRAPRRERCHGIWAKRDLLCALQTQRCDDDSNKKLPCWAHGLQDLSQERWQSRSVF